MLLLGVWRSPSIFPVTHIIKSSWYIVHYSTKAPPVVSQCDFFNVSTLRRCTLSLVLGGLHVAYSVTGFSGHDEFLLCALQRRGKWNAGENHSASYGFTILKLALCLVLPSNGLLMINTLSMNYFEATGMLYASSCIALARPDAAISLHDHRHWPKRYGQLGADGRCFNIWYV